MVFFYHVNKLTILYSSVFSHDQKNDLLTQQQKLLHYAHLNNFNNIKLISDLGSGLNYKKFGLNSLLNLINSTNKHFNHKDRLLRFGSEMSLN